VLYAAYGSNLDPAQMRERCPHSPLRANGWLQGWRLTFGGEDLGWEGALATIVQDPREAAFVGLYDVTDADAEALRRWEGNLYRTLKVRVSALDGEHLAWTFTLDGYEGGLPSARYLGLMAEAAEQAGAPRDYVAELRGRPCRSN
jgi:hypothetical protein